MLFFNLRRITLVYMLYPTSRSNAFIFIDVINSVPVNFMIFCAYNWTKSETIQNVYISVPFVLFKDLILLKNRP